MSVLYLGTFKWNVLRIYTWEYIANAKDIYFCRRTMKTGAPKTVLCIANVEAALMNSARMKDYTDVLDGFPIWCLDFTPALWKFADRLKAIVCLFSSWEQESFVFFLEFLIRKCRFSSRRGRAHKFCTHISNCITQYHFRNGNIWQELTLYKRLPKIKAVFVLWLSTFRQPKPCLATCRLILGVSQRTAYYVI